jgi:surfeit locus 1 family protein
VTLGTAAQPNTGRAPRSPLVLFAVFAAALVLFSTFVALGTWQIHRRSWKLDLIARVNQRVHAPPVAAPREPNWPAVTAANSEYLHVRADGIFLNDRETLVQATTELGAGYWVLTPLRLSDGSIVLVNRGFVPPERRDRAAHSAAAPTTPATVTGLLRVTEPGGGFLRHNDPAANRWYSRDVQAIAAARGLRHVAPYFIDAEAEPVGAGPTRAAADTAVPPRASPRDSIEPVAGLTVITFHNSHLVYVITWYTLALLVIAGVWIMIREERRLRHQAGAKGGLP